MQLIYTCQYSSDHLISWTSFLWMLSCFFYHKTMLFYCFYIRPNWHGAYAHNCLYFTICKISSVAYKMKWLIIKDIFQQNKNLDLVQLLVSNFPKKMRNLIGCWRTNRLTHIFCSVIIVNVMKRLPAIQTLLN